MNDYIFILSLVKKGFKFLILTYSEITDGDITSIIIDTPTVLLYFVNTIGIATYIINIHYGYAIVRIDSDMIDIVCWSSEVVAINTINETTPAEPSSSKFILRVCSFSGFTTKE